MNDHITAIEERREITAEDLMADIRQIMAEIRQIRADMGGRFSAFQARAAAENAAQIPGYGEESSLLRPGYTRAEVATESVANPPQDRELGALVAAAGTTIVTAVLAAAVGFTQRSPETVLLVVVDLLPWLIGLAGVYMVCRTVRMVLGARR